MNARRRGLGRGLDALLGEQPAPQPAAEATSALRDLPISDLKPNRFQPRTHFDGKGIADLAESIQAQGILQPLVVTADGQGKFSIIAGERRWRAAQAAGLTQVPVLVREVAGDQELLELALVENIQRADLDVIEEAEAYEQLAEKFGLSQEAIGKRVGKSRPSVANALRLLRLPPAIRDMLRDGRLTAGQARPLLALGNTTHQLELAERAIAEGLTARELEKLATEPRTAPKAKKELPEADVHTRVAMEKLTRSLQTHVEIRRKRRGGDILIKFHTEDELIRLFDHLTQAKGEP